MPDGQPPSPQIPARLPAAEIPSLRALLAVVVGVVLVTALQLGRDVLIPITLAVLLSFVLAPVVALLRRLWIGRIPAVLLASALALGAMLFVGGVIAAQLASLAADAPRYAYTVERKLEAVRSVTVDRLSEVIDGLASRLPGRTEEEAAPAERGNGGRDEARPIPVELRQPPPTAMELAQRLIGPVLHPLATAAIVFVVAVFVLLQREDLRDRLIRLAGSTDLHRTTTALDDAARRLSRYFLTQLVINTAYGAVTGLVLYLIGVPGALLWGILAGLMRYVPFVGTPIAAAPPIMMAAAVDPGWGMVVWTAAYYLVGEGLMGQVVEPVAFGHSTGLSPISVVIAAIFWSWLWGPIGLILAMPLTLCLVVLGRHVERLAFLDVLLGDRPALTPHESFYQRMLAGDPDEALDQAEVLLRERSLSAYYDDVVLRGLQLAATDAARGTLPPERLDAVRDAARTVIGDLADRPDNEPERDAVADSSGTDAEEVEPLPDIPAAGSLPPEWRSPRAVLCIAGRGPLDEAAAQMLAQLLLQHGLGAQMVPHAAVARAEVGRLDPDGVAMVCISYLEISGSPGHLRYLIRRLRQRLPGVTIAVGLWPAEEAVLTDPQLQAAIGADLYTSTLREALRACLAKASAAGAETSPALAPAD